MLLKLCLNSDRWHISRSVKEEMKMSFDNLLCMWKRVRMGCFSALCTIRIGLLYVCGSWNLPARYYSFSSLWNSFKTYLSLGLYLNLNKKLDITPNSGKKLEAQLRTMGIPGNKLRWNQISEPLGLYFTCTESQVQKIDSALSLL